MAPGIVRYHYAGQMNDSARDAKGWVIAPSRSSYRWDRAKINAAMTGAYGFGPVVMMNICNWPSYLNDRATGRLVPSRYAEYANFCADLVRYIG